MLLKNKQHNQKDKNVVTRKWWFELITEK